MKFLSLLGPLLLATTAELVHIGQTNLGLEMDKTDESYVKNKKMIQEKLKIDPRKQPWFDSHAEKGRPRVSLAASISYELSKSLGTTNTLTMDVSTRGKCPLLHECHLEAHTWHTKVKGECDNFPRAKLRR
ncbi:hypothetical protein MAJ_11031, partial [Metarhizium majus ARSEF 297]